MSYQNSKNISVKYSTEMNVANTVQYIINLTCSKQEKKFVLNNDSTSQYLAKRLNVPIETIYFISLKYPSTLRVSPIKLKEILDFLLNEGYKPIHILRIPRLFTHSIFTLQVSYKMF